MVGCPSLRSHRVAAFFANRIEFSREDYAVARVALSEVFNATATAYLGENTLEMKFKGPLVVNR